jgi:hypothetical protein
VSFNGKDETRILFRLLETIQMDPAAREDATSLFDSGDGPSLRFKHAVYKRRDIL